MDESTPEHVECSCRTNWPHQNGGDVQPDRLLSCRRRRTAERLWGHELRTPASTVDNCMADRKRCARLKRHIGGTHGNGVLSLRLRPMLVLVRLRSQSRRGGPPRRLQQIAMRLLVRALVLDLQLMRLLLGLAPVVEAVLLL